MEGGAFLSPGWKGPVHFLWKVGHYCNFHSWAGGWGLNGSLRVATLQSHWGYPAWRRTSHLSGAFLGGMPAIPG